VTGHELSETDLRKSKKNIRETQKVPQILKLNTIKHFLELFSTIVASFCGTDLYHAGVTF
jgi:hypothetical protein